jgi:hypothetical protein
VPSGEELLANLVRSKIGRAVREPATEEELERIFVELPALLANRKSARQRALAAIDRLTDVPSSRWALLRQVVADELEGDVGVRELADAADQHRARDPQQALELARLAVELGEELPEDRLAEMALRHALLILSKVTGERGEFAEAETALARASKLYSIDPRAGAELAEYRGLLATFRDHPAAAVELFDRAKRGYQRHGAMHDGARCDALAAIALCDSGEPELGARRLALALCDVEARREPRLALSISHNLVRCLARSGAVDEALALLPIARAFHSRVGQRTDGLRLRWLEGSLLLQLARTSEAVEAYESAIAGFAELELPMEVAAVSLEAAEAFAARRDWRNAARVVAHAEALFRGLGLERERLAAVGALVEALQAGAATVAMLRAALTLPAHA